MGEQIALRSFKFVAYFDVRSWNTNAIDTPNYFSPDIECIRITTLKYLVDTDDITSQGTTYKPPGFYD